MSENIRAEILEININMADAAISKLPTTYIRMFRNSLAAHVEKGDTDEMLEKLDFYLKRDELRFKEHCESVAKCSHDLEESIL
jgi:hypothetical protein